jgi:hypothetical protein
MPAIKTKTIAKPTRTREGRPWLKDTEFCDSVRTALKESYDNEEYKAVTVAGKLMLRQLRGALRYFTDEEGWGLTLKTEGDEESPDDGEEYTVIFLARVKNDAPSVTGPRRVRRRKRETDEEYDVRVRDLHPRKPRESEVKYEERIESLKSVTA